jgi:hypothetical protein
MKETQEQRKKTKYCLIFGGMRDLQTGFELMTGFIARLYLLQHFINHHLTHYVFSSPTPLTAALRNSLNSLSAKVKVKVTLRLAVYRQSICLGVKPLETHYQNFFLPPTEPFRY